MKTIKDIEREIEIFISSSDDKKSSKFQKQLKFYREAKSLVSSVPADMIQAQLTRQQEKLAKLLCPNRIKEFEGSNPGKVNGLYPKQVESLYKKLHSIDAIEYSIELMEFVLEPVNVI